MITLLITTLYMYLIIVHNSTAYFIGNHDRNICVRSNLSQSCDHQLDPGIRTSVECNIEYVPQKDCPDYNVRDVFEPNTTPFNLGLYKIKDEIFHNVYLNISFPSPKWKTMSFSLRNQLQPETKICRKFSLNKNSTVNITSTLFWDCYIFTVEQVEENYYDLFLKDDQLTGGVYAFKIISVQNYDVEATNVTTWHVFFFIHQHYLEVSGKLVITLHPAPFSNISYSISMVQCLNENQECEERLELYNYIMHQERFSAEEVIPTTVELKTVTMPGFYAVSVQILSPLCREGKCETSLSPIFEWPRTYATEIVLGFLTLVILLTLSTFFVIRRIHSNMNRYIKKKVRSKDSVMFVYLAESEEMFLLFEFLAELFSKTLCIRPLLVEEDVGSEDPNDWTCHQLCHASKVLFFIPKNAKFQSCTHIQHQWHCAITYFSGIYMKENNVLSRCASVILPTSSPIPEGDQIYRLKKFYLEKDLVSIANWLHRNRFLDKLLYWRPVIHKVTKDLSAFIRFAIDPVNNERPDFSVGARDRQSLPEVQKPLILPAGSIEDSSFSSLKEEGEEKHHSQISHDFDPLSPDVNCVRFNKSIEEDTEDEACDGGSSDDNIRNSLSDVMNFAI